MQKYNVYVTEISINGRAYTVWITGKRNEANCIALTDQDIDKKWFNDILQKSYYENSVQKCDKQNKEFLQLYILFSLKRRVYLDDFLSIYDKDSLISEAAGKKIAPFYMHKLDFFMKSHEYEYCVLKSNVWLYLSGAKPFFNVKKYSKRQRLSLAGLCFSCNDTWMYTRSLFISYTMSLSRIISKNHIKSTLLKKYNNVEQLKLNSNSGCIFFKVENNNGDVLFAKCQTLFSGSMESELEIAKKLEKSKNKHLFLLPDTAVSSKSIMIFPYMKTADLDSYMNDSWDDCDISAFTGFVQNAVSVLRENGISHRDITPKNICMTTDRHFVLIDFGMATEQREIISNDYNDSMCGSSYRYSFAEWDDAFSAWQIALELSDGDNKSLQNLWDMCGSYKVFWRTNKWFV